MSIWLCGRRRNHRGDRVGRHRIKPDEIRKGAFEDILSMDLGTACGLGGFSADVTVKARVGTSELFGAVAAIRCRDFWAVKPYTTAPVRNRTTLCRAGRTGIIAPFLHRTRDAPRNEGPRISVQGPLFLKTYGLNSARISCVSCAWVPMASSPRTAVILSYFR